MGKKHRKGFNVGIREEHGYTKGIVHLYSRDTNETKYSEVGEIEFGYDNERNEYYMGNFRFPNGNFKELKLFYKIAKDIRNNPRTNDIKKLLNYLQENYYEMVYDPRLNEYIKKAEIEPKEYDEYFAYDPERDSSMFGVLAKTFEEAEKKLIAKAKKEGYNWIGVKDWLKNEDRKVRKNNFDSYPEENMKSIEEILGISLD